MTAHFICSLAGEVQMPVDLTYSGVFLKIFLGLGIVFAYLPMFGYRLIAASLFPRLCEWKCYGLFLLLTGVILRQFRPFHNMSISENVFFAVVLFPSIMTGIIEIVRKCRWHIVLLSCAIETLLFPIWLDMVFLASLFFEEAD